ncbi:YeeE/YedE family protein [Rubrobacter taiwanensis]|uniref:YeeE/YedE family protein n=1 Tax=Rubrobacter taiwanensis TaxID=185139 RepID=A0A4R1BHW3_9ACTN|nr:YeeE/YedE thiosulfate transporter family protein [Rubrobacter taiwanensis]TCJ16866.1 YeeE/YedE family protein [Rubrobacter taiwanensis]
MENFTPVSGFIGGLLIGLSVVLLLWLNGRIGGISGIVGNLVLLRRAGELGWRLAFVVGLLLGGGLYALFAGGPVEVSMQASGLALIVAGLLVGFGSRLGSGCTSGHGVCGIARFSGRSIVATVVFFSVAAATVFVLRHVV